MENPNQKKSNPLSAYFRQPKIFIKLPSQGEYYPAGALDKSTNGDYPVFAMTAKDELMFKTPDALISGQSTVEVIKSCVPAIQDPWLMPSLDLDVCLIGIRIATYGENMEVEANCPHCNHLNEYEINLVQWLDQISAWRYDPKVVVDPLTIWIRPYTYKEISQSSLKTLEQQRIFNIINDEDVSDEVKLEKFGKSFVKLTELTVDIVSKCVAKIETPQGSTEDTEQIQEFINNCPKDIFDKIVEHTKDMKKNIELPVQHVQCDSCHKDFEMPVTMDQSNFFAVRS